MEAVILVAGLVPRLRPFTEIIPKPLLPIGKFYNYAIEINANLTMAMKQVITQFRFGNILFDGDFVTSIDEKLDIKINILPGIYVMKPEIFRFIPNNKKFGMDKLIGIMLKVKCPIVKYLMHEYWLNIGVADDYKKTQNIYEKYFKEV